jgi:hypothetical protein
MSLKRTHTASRSSTGGSSSASKIDRQSLFDELRRLGTTGDAFSSVDVALAIGTEESVVAKALIGLASTGLLERGEGGRYRATPMNEVGQAEFVKALAQTSHSDPGRQRDLSEIGRLKQNNDIMRQRLLAAIAERDHYLAVLRGHGIDPGPPPAATVGTVPGAPAPSEPAAADHSGATDPPSEAVGSDPASS